MYPNRLLARITDSYSIVSRSGRDREDCGYGLDMGTFRVEIEVGDPGGRRYEAVEATYTTLPASMLRKLGVAPISASTFALADGRRIRKEIGQTPVRLNGEQYIVPVVFGDEDTQPLIGAVTLEIFRLGIDPVRMRLIPVEGLLL